jgi:polysaccharide deacetylase family protein (PEP-CTERM system associated)
LIINSLTVDVEEYFHPTELRFSTDSRQWDSLPSRVGEQVSRILELLERKQISATFFVLGWVAEHKPQVIRAIANAGHEIGCHSYAHRLVYELSPEEFQRDTKRAVAAIEDACSIRPCVYRAPSYSITERSMWALEKLVECGFRQDSSIYPVPHDRYGIPAFNRHAHVIHTPSGPILEVPAATVQLSQGHVAPIGGGAYLRLLPYRYTAAGIRRVNREEQQPVCLYFHPWEIDPGIPHLATGLVSELRTYSGISGMSQKLNRLLTDFDFTTIGAAYPVASPALAASRNVLSSPEALHRSFTQSLE